MSLGRVGEQVPAARRPGGAHVPLRRGARGGLAGPHRPHALPVASGAVLLALRDAAVAPDAEAACSAHLGPLLQHAQRPHRAGAADHVLREDLPLGALLPVQGGPRLRPHAVLLHRAAQLHGVYGLLEHLPLEDRRLVRFVRKSQYRHGQFVVVRLDPCKAVRSALLPFPPVDPGPRHGIPGHDGTDEHRAGPRQGLQRGVPDPGGAPLRVQPTQRLPEVGPLLRIGRPRV
mmetsp:Transcript_63425/g.164831  ORF Transcript_63425/g.164831 Transcript_63425/m.164831 type:complete len:231 (-) Transcript_63425:356-1048(-)